MQANGTSYVNLNIPSSTNTVSVKIIDVSTISDVPAEKLFTPIVQGIKSLAPAPAFSFLIEHSSGQKVLFDLGIRKDWENLSPSIVQRLKTVGHKPHVEKNISEFLDEHGVGKENINAVIWRFVTPGFPPPLPALTPTSHAHWDHMGDMSTFPAHTDLIVGPGFKSHFLGEGKGNNALGGVLPSDTAGRNVIEITFTDSCTLQIGHFPAYDYFSDGSLYLLDSPGHCVGHLCALARTTSSPDTYVFLGGDAAHHGSEMRPSAYVPFPDSIIPNPVDLHNRSIRFCPAAWFEDLQTPRGRDPKGPLWQPAFGHDMKLVMESIGKMQEYDGDENVFVCLAHDAALREEGVPIFPEKLNDWKERGLGQKLRWWWMGDVVRSLKGE